MQRSPIKTVGNVKGFSSNLLDSTRLVTHFFCSRLGGVSKGVFASLNLSSEEGDEEGDVLENKGIVAKAFGFSVKDLFTLRQVHGDKVLVIDSNVEYGSTLVGDGIVTHRRGIAIGVLTADCLPILLLEPVKRIIGVLHGGWRGLVKGIIEEGIRVMEERYRISRDALLVAIGPFIKRCCYTVGKDVADMLRREDLSRCLITKGGEIRFDLGRLAMGKLEDSGVRKENIEFVGPCTSCDEGHLFSYRRDGRTGRQLSFIRLC